MRRVRQAVCVAIAGTSLLAMSGLAGAQTAGKSSDAAAAIARGKVKFERACAPCHGRGPGHDGSPQLPGTAALARKYGAERPGALELREDLTPDILGFFVRNGSGPMPGFRKTEISDAEISDVAAYLRTSADKNAVR